MQFLGTAAGDAMPNPYCKCMLCEDARRDPGRARLRSILQLDETNLIDFGPDLCGAAVRHNADLTKIKNVFLTHSHDDHFCDSNISLMRMCVTRVNDPLELYCSETAYPRILRLYTDFRLDSTPDEAREGILDRGSVHMHMVKPYITFQAGGYDVMPVLTTHGYPEQAALNYRFKKDGRSMLYAVDTGYYLEDSLEALRDSKLDTLIMEGTWGNATDKSTLQHLSGPAFVHQLDTFFKYGIIRKDTAIYVTHINHKHSWTPEAYQKFFDESTDFNVAIAWDGMQVEF